VVATRPTDRDQDPITGAPFWEQPMSLWLGMFERGVRNHILSSRMAAPLFVRQHHGLIVTTSPQGASVHHGISLRWSPVAAGFEQRVAMSIPLPLVRRKSRARIRTRSPDGRDGRLRTPHQEKR
jgi:hypothetical protein